MNFSASREVWIVNGAPVSSPSSTQVSANASSRAYLYVAVKVPSLSNRWMFLRKSSWVWGEGRSIGDVILHVTISSKDLEKAVRDVRVWSDKDLHHRRYYIAGSYVTVRVGCHYLPIVGPGESRAARKPAAGKVIAP